MVNVTEAACSRLAEKLSKRSSHVAARVVIRRGRGELRQSKQRPGDKVFQHEGRTVLLLAEAVAERFDDRTLDVRDTEAGPKLRFRRTK